MLKKTAAFFIFFVLAGHSILAACPLCADLIARSQDTVHALGFGRGIFWSILILLGVPLALGVSFSIFLISAARKREKSVQNNML